MTCEEFRREKLRLDAERDQLAAEYAVLQEEVARLAARRDALIAKSRLHLARHRELMARAGEAGRLD